MNITKFDYIKIKKNHTFLAIILCLTVFYSGCSGKASKPKKKKGRRMVLTQILNAENIDYKIQLTAEVVALEKATVSSMVDGQINYAKLREGDKVVSGDNVITISREVYRAEVMLAKASLNIAKAKLLDIKAGFRPQEISKSIDSVKECQKNYEFAKKELKRIKNLFDNGAVSEEELEKTQVKLVSEQSKFKSAKSHLNMLKSGMTHTSIAIQKASVEEAKAKLSLAEAKLAECEIKAPFTGVISHCYVNKGDMAVPRSPLFTLLNNDSQVLICAIPEKLSSNIAVNMPVEFTLDSNPKLIRTGHISRVYPTLDKSFRTRKIEITPDNTKLLSPGMFARVNILIKKHMNVFAIPTNAVSTNSDGKHIIFTLNPDSTVKKNIVQIGPEINGKIVIDAQLNVGQQIIVAGFEKLKDGMKVFLPKTRNKSSGAKSGKK